DDGGFGVVVPDLLNERRGGVVAVGAGGECGDPGRGGGGIASGPVPRDQVDGDIAAGSFRQAERPGGAVRVFVVAGERTGEPADGAHGGFAVGRGRLPKDRAELFGGGGGILHVFADPAEPDIVGHLRRERGDFRFEFLA